jgi:hypothetical protein
VSSSALREPAIYRVPFTVLSQIKRLIALLMNLLSADHKLGIRFAAPLLLHSSAAAENPDAASFSKPLLISIGQFL